MPSAFWDTSALVPICIQEPTSQAADLLALRFSQIVWWATSAEIHSAIARSARFGMLNPAEERTARQLLTTLSGKWDEILPSSQLRDLACRLLDAHPLRTADSFQLAAALIWCRNRAAGRTFISSDLKLCQAAALEGFTVIQP